MPVIDDARTDKDSRAAPRSLQRQDLLRRRRPRGVRRRAASGRGRASRAALSVPDRGHGRRSSPSYPALDEVVWVQEEPQNMGPWRSIRHRLEECAAGAPLRYIGRPWRASPSEGYPDGAPDRAGQDRPRRADAVGRRASGAGSAEACERLAGEPRPVLARLACDPATLLRRQAAPDVEHGQRRAHDADPAAQPHAWHGAILHDPALAAEGRPRRGSSTIPVGEWVRSRRISWPSTRRCSRR